jgi:hypothetical protein
MPTCCVAELTFAADDWATIDFGQASLKVLDYPKLDKPKKDA